MNPEGVVILIDENLTEDLKAKLQDWAERLRFPTTTDTTTIHLTFLNDRLVLRHRELPRMAPLEIDLVGGDLGHRRKYGRVGKNQLMGKALGLAHSKHPRVLDATGGLGADTFSMRLLGCSVLYVERSPVVFALFADAVERARREVETAKLVGTDLSLHLGDARKLMSGLAHEERPDVVYLDPMFPPKKKTALAKGEMQYLQKLFSQDETEAFKEARSLVEVALQSARRRVVVKRPLKAEPLRDGVNHVYRGTTIRYDVYHV